MQKQRVAATFKRDFAGAHRLMDFDGKCHNIHGHNYRAIITVDCTVDDVGFTIEYDRIKDAVDFFDHTLIIRHDDPVGPLLDSIRIPYVMMDVNPTTENLAQRIATEVMCQLIIQREVGGQTIGELHVVVELHETEHIAARALVFRT